MEARPESMRPEWVQLPGEVQRQAMLRIAAAGDQEIRPLPRRGRRPGASAGDTVVRDLEREHPTTAPLCYRRRREHA
jgi:hypothetical protein